MSSKKILKASAGTGKTYRLSLEYIKALNEGIDFKNILIMTFTKKATGEIRSRIFKFLQEVCDKSESALELENNLKQIYGDDFKFKQDILKRAYEDIIKNKDKIKIYTIDSFTNSVFKKIIAPFLKIYSYDILNSDDDNKKYLLKTFEKIFENKELFNNFKDFLQDNSEKNMDKYIQLIGKILNERWKLKFLNELENPEKEMLEFQDKFKFLDRIVENLKMVEEIKKKPFEKLIKKKFLPLFEKTTIEDRENFILENYKEFLEDTIWSGVTVRASKGDIDYQLENLNHYHNEFVYNFSRELFNLYIIPYEKKLLKVMGQIEEIYEEIKLKEKKFTHLDISNMVFKYFDDRDLGMINEGGLVDDFYDIIESRVEAIFIDEFQDTSILQWSILKKLIDKCDKLICVGDEKQSIYSWRGGEKKLFENLDIIVDGEVENLDKCYRCKENIVKYTNDVFKKISNYSNDIFGINDKWEFVPVNFLSKENSGFVQITFNEDEEYDGAEEIIKILNDKFKGNYNGIGILARKKKTLQMIAEKLKDNNIPYIIETDSCIVESKGILGIYFLLKFLVKKEFLSLLEFFRSDIIMIDNGQLKEIISNQEIIENYLYYDIPMEEKIESYPLIELVKTILINYQNSSFGGNDTIYNIFDSLEVANILSNKEDLVNLFTFYELLSGYDTIDEFLTEFEEEINNGKFNKNIISEKNSIQLMTIHKAKGLEFDTVFYFIENRKKPTFNEFKFYVKFDEKYEKLKDFMITDTKFNSILKKIDEYNFLEEYSIKEQQEEINNMYVALTRPVNNLFVIPEKMKIFDDYSEVGYLKEYVHKNDEILINENEETQEFNCDFVLDLSIPEKEYIKSYEELRQERFEKLDKYDISFETKRVKGSAVHYFLENIERWNDENIDFAKQLTLNKYSGILPMEELNEIFSKKNIEYIYEKCKRIFEGDWDTVHSEYSISIYEDEELKNYRLDKLLIKNPVEDVKGKILIIDYKTGKIDVEQMEKYKGIISNELKFNRLENDFEIETEFIILEL